MDLGDFDPSDADADTDADGESTNSHADEHIISETTESSASKPGTETDRHAESNADTGTDAESANRNTADDTNSPTFESYGITPTGQDAGLGTIAVSQGLRIAEDDDETRLRAYVTADNRDRIRIGTYLLVPYPDQEMLFCRIAAVEYAQEFHTDDATEIHARRAMRRDEFTERDYKFVATLRPLAILFNDSTTVAYTHDDSTGEATLTRRMVDRVPKPGAIVRAATDPEQIKTGLNIPSDGVFLGHLSVGGERVETAASPPTIDYRLNDNYTSGDPLIFRHTLIAGGTGSGKTHASKNVLRQLLSEDRTYEMDDGRLSRLAVVQFDPQDEYAQMHDNNPVMDSETARRYEREGITHGGHDDTIALVPKEEGVTYSGDTHRAEQLRFTIPFSMVRSRPWLVAGSQLNENQYPALRHLLTRFFNEYGNSGTYSGFKTFLENPTLREELDESGRVHEATFDAVKRRVWGVPDTVFDQSARPITELDHQLVRPGGLSVIPTYHLSSTRVKEMIVLAVSSLLVDDKLSNDPYSDRINRTPLLVGMDEAHNFLTDADTVQARKVIGKFTEAAKQGRKERLGLFLITQDPQDIAESVFKQVNTKLILNLGDEDAIKSVNIPAALENKVPYMKKGQQVVYSPDNSEPVEIQGLRHCLTRHGE
ncbi:ATP-binding protein [Haloquadratum walsbyi]|jgi:Predicted ATPase|uniref:Putative ATPase n=1 Tax=Haloquadratum walsbyi J07HQW2 TaxID=1238425 RepID=U1NEQ6_9EURY|nr:ATP-binding protein [Haloquadratum walsbyi]ERG95510.1 MAG: putative ATPase [Haloquadratum walsbyi J07HQW2]